MLMAIHICLLRYRHHFQDNENDKRFYGRKHRNESGYYKKTLQQASEERDLLRFCEELVVEITRPP